MELLINYWETHEPREENVANTLWVSMGPVWTQNDPVMYKLTTVVFYCQKDFLSHILDSHCNVTCILSVSQDKGKRTIALVLCLDPLILGIPGEATSLLLTSTTPYPSLQRSIDDFPLPNSYMANMTPVFFSFYSVSEPFMFVCVYMHVGEGWILIFLYNSVISFHRAGVLSL